MSANMCAEVEATLVAMAEDIRARDARISQLRAFLSRIEAMPDCFTADEIRATQTHIEAEAAERAQRCALLEEKVAVYEMRVLELHQKMTMRRECIDVDSGLEAAPALLEIFVQQQANMSKELDEAHSFLMS